MRWAKLLVVLALVAFVQAAILGIDYGQQYTKAVLLAPNINFDIVLNNEGKRKDLSGMCIRKTADGMERVYGSSALSLLNRFPTSCVTDLKTLMGKEFESQDVQQYSKSHFVNLKADSNRRQSVKLDFVGSQSASYQFTPEEVLAMELNQVKERAEQMLALSARHSKLDDIVISIAPFATQETRQSYLDALELVGIKNIIGLVEDGTAVALNYVSNKKLGDVDYDDEKKYSIVYDMGAGSTTATLFSITPFSSNKTIQVEIEALGYETSISGKALTDMVYNVLIGKFMDEFKVDLKDITPRTSSRIRDAAEKAKTILSANTDYRVSLESIADDKDFRTSISRDEIEEIANDLMPLITKPILSALKDAGKLPILSLEAVILNGGSTRVPFVQKHLSVLLGGDEKIAKTVNTDESCALGVTFAGYLSKNPSAHIKLVDKVFHNYQIKINDLDEETLVFTKGDIVGSTKTLNLGPLKPEIGIELYEDDCLIKIYTFDDLVKKSSKLSCSSKDEKSIVGVFSIDNNKIFELQELNVECIKTGKKDAKPGFFENLIKKKEKEDTIEDEESEPVDEVDEADIDIESVIDEQDEDNSTESTTNSTAKESKKTIKKVKLRKFPISKPRAKQARINPFLRLEKKEIGSRLLQLDLKDKEKALVEAVKNEVEANCYKLRSEIEDLEEVLLEIWNEEDIEAHRTYVSDLLEWLDFESTGATLKEVKKHLKEVTGKLTAIANASRIKDVDLSSEGMYAVIMKAQDTVDRVLEILKAHEVNISDFQALFNESGFDFALVEKSFDSKQGSTGFRDKLEEIFNEQVGKLQDVQSTIVSSIENLSKPQLFEIYNGISEVTEELEQTLKTAVDLQNKRVKYYTQRFDKLVERKKLKEMRKLKEELLKAASESLSASDSSASTESADTQKSSSTEEAVHDEL